MIALALVGALCALAPQGPAKAAPKAFAVRAETLYTMAGAPVKGGVVVVRDGKIAAVGKVDVPDGLEVVEAKVVMPGLIDAHATVGLSGVLNVPQDQDQLDASSPTQPELRALDAYHARDPLVEWVRGLGVTTLHTGHGPGALISGQTMVVKTHGRSVDADVVAPLAMVAVTLADSGRSNDGKGPGTRAKSVAVLRQQLLAAQHYAARRERDPDGAVDRPEEGCVALLYLRLDVVPVSERWRWRRQWPHFMAQEPRGRGTLSNTRTQQHNNSVRATLGASMIMDEPCEPSLRFPRCPRSPPHTGHQSAGGKYWIREGSVFGQDLAR